MELGPVTKHDKRNTGMSKEIDDEVMSTIFDVIDVFSIYGQFGEIRIPDFGSMVFKTYIFINSNILSYKTKNITKKFHTQLSYHYFE